MSDVREFVERYENFQQTLAEFVGVEEDIRDAVKRAFDEEREEDLADLSYILRQWELTADEYRKELKAKVTYATKHCALFVARRAAIMGDDAAITIRGNLGMATPDVRSGVAMPKKGSAEYVTLCKWAGVDEKLIEEGSVNFSYDGLSATAQRFMDEGKPLPPGLVTKYEKFICTYRTVK